MGKASKAIEKARSKAMGAVSKEGIGKTGLEIVEVGTSALLGLASKNMELPYGVKPDVAGVAVGLGLMLSGGKRTKLGKAVFKGSLQACIGRAIWDPKGITLIQGQATPAPAKPSKPLVGTVNLNVGAEPSVTADDGDDDDDNETAEAEAPKKAA